MKSCYSLLLVASLALGLVSANVYKYEVEQKGTICLIAELDADVMVNYKTKDGKTELATIPLPAEAAPGVSISGWCATENDTVATLNIQFSEVELEMNFTDTEGQVALGGLAFTYKQDGELFPNASATGSATASKTDMLLTMGSDQEYFICRSTIDRKINDAVSVDIKSIKAQAFNVKNDFSPKPSICAQDQSTTAPPPSTPTSPTPTAKPTPPPTPKPGNWTVKDPDSGTVCIVATMGVRFEIPYVKKDKTNATAMIDLPAGASADGSMCGNGSQTLSLKFNDNWVLEMDFVTEAGSENDNTKSEYSVHNISLTYYQTKALFPGSRADPSKEMMSRADNLDLFRAGTQMSFICQSKQAVPLSHNVTLDTYNLHVQAFKTDNGTAFQGTDKVCPKDVETNGIIPIAVGAALAALVFIVVIAYIIGRKRRYQGYEAL